MKNFKILKFNVLVSLAILSVGGCKVYNQVSSNYDKSVDFSKYKTFAWLPDKDSSKTEYDNQIIRNNTRNYFSHCMGDRGYKADVVNPDIFLELVITATKKHETISSTDNMAYPSNYLSNPYYYPFPNAYYYQNPYNYNYSTYSVTQKIEYTEGGITLNVIDRKQNKLIWTGTAKADLYDPSSIGENLHPAVYDILKSYPVPPIQKQKRPKQQQQINGKIK